MARKYREIPQQRHPQRDPEAHEHAQLRKELQEELRQTRRLEGRSRPQLDLKEFQGLIHHAKR
jgi:hypothetical protein